MKMTMTPARALVCAPAAPHTDAVQVFRGATPYGAGVEGTSLSRVRPITAITQDSTVQGAVRDNTVQDKAMGPAARGKPF